MIKTIIFAHFCIVLTFGQLVQNNPQNLSSVGINQTNQQNQNLVTGQQLVITNDSKPQNQEINNGSSNELNSTLILKQKSILTTLKLVVNLSSTVVTQSSVFNVVNVNEAKTLSPISKKKNNLTKEHPIKHEKKMYAIDEFPSDFMSEEVSDRLNKISLKSFSKFEPYRYLAVIHF